MSSYWISPWSTRLVEKTFPKRYCTAGLVLYVFVDADYFVFTFYFFNKYAYFWPVFLILSILTKLFSWQWIPELRHYASSVCIILVGTKLGGMGLCFPVFYLDSDPFLFHCYFFPLFILKNLCFEQLQIYEKTNNFFPIILEQPLYQRLRWVLASKNI